LLGSCWTANSSSIPAKYLNQEPNNIYKNKMKTQALRTLAQITVATTLSAIAFAVPATQTGTDGNVVIKAGKVITLSGETIENGTILIEGGRITAVGKDIKYPWSAEVKEFPDAVAFPGFVEALTNSGMDSANENIDVAAFLNVKDSIDPVNFYYEDALRAGITTINVQQGRDCVIGGRGYVVKPTGMTVEEMTVRPNSGIAISAVPKRNKSRATQAFALRRAFDDLRRYLDEVVEEKRDGKDLATREALYQGREPDEETSKGRAMGGDSWKVEDLQLIPRWEIDEKQAPVLDMVEGKIPAFFYCGSPADVHTAISVAKENGFLKRTTLVLSGDCWKAADAIAANKVPVILSGSVVYLERDPVTGEEIETFVPGVFQSKGVEFALLSGSSSTQALWYQAALCVGQGMTREQAIAAVTTTPARLIGLEKRVGTLEPGKDGNVVIFSGDPLSVTSHVEMVVIEGNEVYDRATDVRVRHLSTGEQPASTAPEGDLEGKPHDHPDPEEVKEDKTDEGENEEAEEGDDDEHEDHDDDKKGN
jgi:imidazolonepropionase-like amidohydrolase